MATRRIELRWPLLAHPLGIALAVIVLLGVLRTLVDINLVVLLGFAALLLSVVFSFPVNLLSRVIPRGVAVVLTLIASLGIAGAVGAFAYPMLAKQFGAVAQHLPEGMQVAKDWLSGRKGGPVGDLPQAQKQKVAEHVEQRLGDLAGSALSKVIPAAMSLTEAASAAVLLLILAAFLVYEPDAYRRGLRKLVPTQYEDLFDEAWHRLAHDLRHWVGGTIVSMTIMGTLCGLGLALVGVDSWFLLALLTFFGTFVPYLGALASAGPGLLVALARSPGTFFWAGCVYLGVHIVEGYVVQPFVMRRAVELKPALLLFGQACVGAVFGVMGVVVATPLMVCAQTLVKFLWVEHRLGKLDAPGKL